jgi:hypothetical protein
MALDIAKPCRKNLSPSACYGLGPSKHVYDIVTATQFVSDVVCENHPSKHDHVNDVMMQPLPSRISGPTGQQPERLGCFASPYQVTSHQIVSRTVLCPNPAGLITAQPFDHFIESPQLRRQHAPHLDYLNDMHNSVSRPLQADSPPVLDSDCLDSNTAVSS